VRRYGADRVIDLDGGNPAGSRVWTWREWGVIFATAVLLRTLVAFVLLRSMPLMDDALDYYQFGVELLTHFPGVRAYYWPPGNSLVLAGMFAIFGTSVTVARVLMLLLGVGGVVFIMLIGCRVTRDAAARKAVSWIAALYMPAVMLAGQSSSQHLAALCMLALAYFGLRAAEKGSARDFMLAGLAFGVGCLTRPSMASVGPFLVAASLVSMRDGRIGRKALGVGLFAAVAAAVIIPVLLHNAAYRAGLTISTNNERNFFLGNNPYTPDYKTWHLGQRALSELDPETRAYLQGMYSRPDRRQAMTAAALHYIVRHPARTAVRTLNRITSFWGFDYLGSRNIQRSSNWSTMGLLPLLALEAGNYIAVMILFITGFFLSADRAAPFWRFWLLVLAVAYQIPYALAFSGGTYHFPVVGLLIPLAGVAVSGLFRGGGVRCGWSRLRQNRAALATIIAFIIIQLQYVYYMRLLRG